MWRDALPPLVALGLLALGAEAGAQAAPVYSATRDLVARGLAYEHGEGVPKDQKLAATMYCEAARSGDAEGQYALGWMHANGRGVERDDAIAAGLFAAAAAQGHEHAQRMLDRMGAVDSKLPDCLSGKMPAAVFLDDSQGVFADLPAYKAQYAEIARRLAPGYGVSPRLALAVIAIESNFEPAAVSPKGARGLMQLIPGTARRFDVKNSLDPAENVHGGLAYLRWLLSYYRGQVALAAAAYNAGEGAVDRHGGVPPYVETRDYVAKIRRLFGSEVHPYDPTLTEPSPVVLAVRPARS